MAAMVEQSAWMRKVTADPGHSTWYVERLRSLAAAGHDLAGRRVSSTRWPGGEHASSTRAAAPAASVVSWLAEGTTWSVSTSTRC